MGGWMDGWVDGWMDAWMSAWMGAGGLYDILKLREPPELMVPTAADRVIVNSTRLVLGKREMLAAFV